MSSHAAQRPRPRHGDGTPAAPVRLVEVARAAGVSSMTVSRALRHPERVAPATLQSVRRAIARLGYLPDGGAAALATRRSRVVAAIVPTLMNSVYASTVHGLAAALRAAGYELMLGDSGYDREVEAALVRSFIGRRVDALVLTGVEHAGTTRLLIAQHRVPVVEIWDATRSPIDMLVGFSNVAAGREAGRWLAAHGRRRWAFVGTAPEREDRSGKRLKGLREAARAAGLPAPETAFVVDGMSAAAGREAVAALLARVPAVDALFCANDALAVAALRAAHEAGVEVPGRLAVMGFGDFDVAAVTRPALTTIAIPGEAIGEAAAEAVLDRLDGRDSVGPVRRDLGFSIVRRESA
ncbi:MAG: LacI family DNA-binding transcriptional regulator [Burkholderiaceae bacterium]|nr:LacI family DNA-binding transcriptional regulator [Burkholderiales bacterium]MCZ8099582.1 LacI family DNA-binding transcriptional regulator [Burkholderiales bacterium]MCZ8339335.1 LacI family DNA-binding transcriptional regulator [Burkholderiaceae bacterium]